MFPGAQQSQQRILQTPQLSFAGGINTVAARNKMGADEAFDINNMRFNEESSLVPRPETVVSVDRIAAATITTRITSIFNARYLSGTVRQFFTTNTNLYEFVDNSAVAPTDIDGGISLPSDTFWMWKMYGNLAIATNRGTGANVNPVKVASVGNAAALAGSPPKAKYIEVWNDRVWLTGTGNDSNTLYGSALGNAEDWTTTGTAGRVIIAIEPGDGDLITGIIAFRERLFIFKRNRIYTVQAVGGAFPTDASALSVELYSQNVGCVSAYSVQPVLDDVLFLAQGGVASLVASERVGDFTAAFLSRKIRDIQSLATVSSGTDLEISAFTVPEHNQYWLLIPDNAFVLDYRLIQEGKVRWTRYTGAMAGTVMARNPYGSITTFVTYNVGGRISSGASTFRIWWFLPNENIAGFDDNNSGNDATVSVLHRIETQIYSLGYPFDRKHFKRMGFDFIGFNAASSTSVTVQYNLDNITSSSAAWVFTIATGNDRRSVKQNRKLKFGSLGARGVEIFFRIDNNALDQGFGLKGISLWFSLLPAKRVDYS